MGKNSEKKRRKREKSRLEQEEAKRRSLSQEPVDRISKSPGSSPPEARKAAPSAQSKSSGIEALLSRKRELTPVTFLFPGSKDGQSRVYTFGSFGSHLSEPIPDNVDASVGTLTLDQKISSATVKDESIDDILYGANKGQRFDLKDPSIKERESKPLGQEMIRRLDDNVEHDHSPTAATPQCHLSGQTVADVVRDKQGLRPRANSTDGELMLPQRGLCDERQVLEAHKWNLVKHQLATLTPKGLMNLGNSCYLNSTVQCLAFLPPFCQTLLSLPDESRQILNDPEGSNGSKRKRSTGKRITFLLRALFRRMHGGSRDNGSAIAPRAFVENVPLLSSIGSSGQKNGKYKFRPGRQEDAHEFLVHLLDAMNDGELQEAGINQHVSGWRDRLPVPRLDETTLLRRIFGGYFRNEVKCTQCEKKSRTYDPFLDLSLEISRKSCNSLADAIREFTRKETLDSENRWKCPGCKKRVCATKQLTVFRPPLALCIQLKRFSFSGSMSFGGSNFHYKSYLGGGKKITKPIEFPAQLDLPLSDGRSCGYALTGLVIHVGGSASSGHYTAYVKRPCGRESSNCKWFHMDDSFVQAVSENSVLRQRDAYVLFYCRREVRLEFPSPPLRASMSAEEATQLSRARARARAESIDNANPERKPDSAPPHRAFDSNREAVGTRMPIIGPHCKPSSIEEVTAQITGKSRLEHTKLTADMDEADADGSVSGSEDDSRSIDNSADQISSSNFSANNDRSDNTGRPISDSPKEPSHTTSTLEIQSQHVHLPHEASFTSTENGKGNKANPSTMSADQTSSKGKTRIVVGRGISRERLEVMLGPRYKRIWKPKTTGLTRKEDFSLLGNQRVSTWSDETESDINGSRQERKELVAAMDRTANKRKREQYLDRWDSALDSGKQKKVKARKEPVVQTEPSDNVFQKIQSDVLNMFGHRKGSHKNKKPSKFFKSSK